MAPESSSVVVDSASLPSEPSLVAAASEAVEAAEPPADAADALTSEAIWTVR